VLDANRAEILATIASLGLNREFLPGNPLRRSFSCSTSGRENPFHNILLRSATMWGLSSFSSHDGFQNRAGVPWASGSWDLVLA